MGGRLPQRVTGGQANSRAEDVRVDQQVRCPRSGDDLFDRGKAAGRRDVGLEDVDRAAGDPGPEAAQGVLNLAGGDGVLVPSARSST